MAAAHKSYLQNRGARVTNSSLPSSLFLRFRFAKNAFSSPLHLLFRFLFAYNKLVPYVSFTPVCFFFSGRLIAA